MWKKKISVGYMLLFLTVKIQLYWSHNMWYAHRHLQKCLDSSGGTFVNIDTPKNSFMLRMIWQLLCLDFIVEDRYNNISIN
jgi:hypothetical protein